MKKPSMKEQVALGRAIAVMYVAAQGVSIKASDAACDTLEGACQGVKWGFNQEMKKHPEYNVRAL